MDRQDTRINLISTGYKLLSRSQPTKIYNILMHCLSITTGTAQPTGIARYTQNVKTCDKIISP